MTDAPVYDSVVIDDLLHGEERERERERVIYGDEAYASVERQVQAEQNKIVWLVNRKARRGRKLNCADKAFNRKSSRTRARVEHVFGIIKDLWNYKKVRHKGLRENASQVFALIALANFYKVRHELAC